MTAVLLGLLASACFSVTFIVNRAIGVAGGHWVWTATLRYAWVLLMLGAWFGIRGRLPAVLEAFRREWRFWVVAGSVGYGIFYTGLAYASTLAPGWVVACTMQATILATPLVLRWFGARVRLHGLALLGLIFFGIVLVNLEHRDESGVGRLSAVLPVLVAAFAFPVGSQLLQEARNGGRGWIPRLDDAVTADAAARVLLMTLGSVPYWGLVLLVPHPTVPSSGQVAGAAIVALLATVVGSSIFLQARNSVGRDANRIAVVDATQAAYTVFSLGGEVAFLGAVLPGPLGVAGLLLVVGGLAAYAWSGTRVPARSVTPPGGPTRVPAESGRHAGR